MTRLDAIRSATSLAELDGIVEFAAAWPDLGHGPLTDEDRRALALRRAEIAAGRVEGAR